MNGAPAVPLQVKRTESPRMVEKPQSVALQLVTPFESRSSEAMVAERRRASEHSSLSDVCARTMSMAPPKPLPTSAATHPRMTITITSSISVKPRWPRAGLTRSPT